MVNVNDWRTIKRSLPSILKELEWDGINNLTDDFIKSWFEIDFPYHSERDWHSVILAVREEVTEKWDAKVLHEKIGEVKKLKVITKPSTNRRRLLIR